MVLILRGRKFKRKSTAVVMKQNNFVNIIMITWPFCCCVILRTLAVTDRFKIINFYSLKIIITN